MPALSGDVLPKQEWQGLLDDPAQPLVEHIIELRRRLINSLLYLAAGSAVAYHYSAPLLSWLAKPAGQLVFSAPTEAFYTRLKAGVFGGLLLTLPFILHQVWLFVGRALAPRFRRLVLLMVPISYSLFLLGVALAVFVVVPAAMRFLLSYGTEDIKPLITLAAYLEFVTGLALAFGAMFQTPLVLFTLNRMGVVSRQALREKWRHIWLLSFILSSFLTPGPDMISQLCLAVPTILLFEITLLTLH